MAIAYSGPRGQTMLLTVNNGKDAAQNVYIHTVIKEVQPLLKTPFILNMIKNTNNDESHRFVNTRYFYNVKRTPGTKISDSENAMITDPRNLASENIKLEVRQLAPVEYAKKLSGAFRDLGLEGCKNTASVAIADFMMERRLDKQEEIFSDLQKAAIAKQKEIVAAAATATSFVEGAHAVQATYNSAQELYDDLNSAINEFMKLGQSNAKIDYNQKIQYVRGIPKQDMFILITHEMAALLLEKPGLYASDKGNELFQKLDLKWFLGVPFFISSQLPAGVNFMIITTGTHGTIGYEEVGNVSFKKDNNGKDIEVLEGTAIMLPDPQWSGFYRIDITDCYKMGIIFDDLVFVSTTNSVTA